MLHRIQELAEEANRADERVLILEEMLHAAEDVNRAEVEERAQLEAWVGDIEKTSRSARAGTCCRVRRVARTPGPR